MSEEVFVRFVYPFWFADTPLLATFLLAEINAAAQLLSDQPNTRAIFDAPDAELSQRKRCFELLAHRNLIEVLDESIVARYETPPSLNDLETRTLGQTSNLVPDDAPEWALELKRVVDQMPLRIVQAMPEPLQTAGYFPDNEERREAVRSAAAPLGTVEQLQMLVKRVVDEQMHRLARRWSNASAVVSPSDTTHTGQHVRKTAPRHNDRGMKRDKLIAEIAGISKTPAEFVRRMDDRDMQPQPTWEGWPGTWTAAYRNEHLRKLIQQDKSRALYRVRTRRGK